MNPNLNDNLPTSSSSECAHGLNGKIKGAAEIAHGLGDNFRGTMLGAVDALGKSGATENDEIEQRGRLETERGIAHWRGHSAPQRVGSIATTNVTPYDPDVNRPMGSHLQQYSDQFHDQYGAETSSPKTAANLGSDQGASNFLHQPVSAAGGINSEAQTTTYPSHHRDDAITKIASGELQEMQGLYRQQNVAPSMQTQVQKVPCKEVYGDSQSQNPVRQSAHPTKADEMRGQMRQAMGQQDDVHFVN